MKRLLATLVLTLAFGAGSLAWGALPVLAVSCSGASHALTLSDGTASPGSGVAGSSFTFSVTYSDNAACAPSSIRVTVNGVGSASLTTAATDFSVPVVFHGSMALPAGTWTYGFSATSGTGNGTQTATLTTVAPAAVVVTPPPPPPTPTPRPTPTPTPRPTPTPTPRPTPTPTPTPSARSSAGSSPASNSTPAAAGSSAPGTSRPASPSPSPSRSPVAAGFAAVDGGGGRGEDGYAAVDVVPGPTGPPSPITLLLLGALITLGGIGLFMAFGAATRRQVPIPAPAFEAVAEPVAPVAVWPSAGASWAETRGLTVATQALQASDTPPEELLIPRWRRPSLRAARQLSERDVPIEHVPILFRAPADPGADRRQVVYRLVRMGTEPDEFAGEEVGRLDRGDEVEVLREEAGYCLVRTPLEAVGWVHRTTLRGFDEGPIFELRLQTDA